MKQLEQQYFLGLEGFSLEERARKAARGRVGGEFNIIFNMITLS